MASFPPLAGQGAAYLRSQLDAFADGSRNNAIMAPNAKGLNAQQRADVAAYFAGLPSGIAPKPAASNDANDKGGWLVLRGRMADGVPACASCHGTNGQAKTGNEPLAGGNKDEMLKKLLDFKRGAKPATIMHQLSKGYSDEQLAAIVSWFAAQKK